MTLQDIIEKYDQIQTKQFIKNHPLTIPQNAHL
jgi:hypothetical protein